MAENTKALRLRIKSVGSTLQLTDAMGLVASSKIKRATRAMQEGREYTKAIKSIIQALSSDRDCQKSAYMQKREEERARIVVIAGDRGLAGGYNANVFRLAAKYPEATFLPVGKRSADRFGGSSNSSEHFSFEQAYALADTLCADFLAGEYDKLGILSTRYHSMMKQEAELEWVLPLEPSTSQNAGMIFEPDQLTVLEEAVREYVAGLLTAAVRESFACEVAARRMAMDSAGKNAREMINDLQLKYNRARQGAITQEITEIVAGSGNE